MFVLHTFITNPSEVSSLIIEILDILKRLHENCDNVIICDF